ncbi:MAG TPA: hypothetical protein VGP47_05605 [Parachlamydiaceae bacterium]|nr:hypothetical protein [Parachlamydiaceae bacterium]
MITSYSSTDSFTYLTDLPKETFVESTVGKVHAKSPVYAIETFCNLKQVCKKLKEKVDNCWGTLILMSGSTSLFIPFYAKKIDFNDPEITKEIFTNIAKQFPTLKKWELLDCAKWDKKDPVIKECTNIGASRQCIVNNHFGNPELWVVNTNRELQNRDLMTHKSFRVRLKDELNPVSRSCHPCMVASKQWIAICCETVEHKKEIAIVSRYSGYIYHRISTLREILEMHREKEFLYVLCRNKSGTSKFLKYDSKDWKAAPKELSFEENVLEFYMSDKEILFISINTLGQYQLSSLPREKCFSDSEAILSKAPFQDNCPKIKILDDVYFTMTPESESTQENPIAILEILQQGGLSITKQCLLKLTVDAHKILDFQAVFDKIFIVMKKNRVPVISCFDLKTGEFIKEFCPETNSCIGTNFRPTLLVQPPHIQLYYSSEKQNGMLVWDGTIKYDLSFKI